MMHRQSGYTAKSASMVGSHGDLCLSKCWHYVEELARVMNVPWLLLGDFNRVVSPSEKKGGSNRWKNKYSRLEWLIELVDMGSHGPRFT